MQIDDDRRERSARGLVLLTASLAIFAGLSGCDRGEVESDIVLTSPASTEAQTEAFGAAVQAVAAAGANSKPRDPALEDMAPVSFTDEPVEIPAP